MVKFNRALILLAASLFAAASAQDNDTGVDDNVAVDPCTTSNLDCDGCVTTEAADCVFCPADGQCRLNVESDFRFRCIAPDEFVTNGGSCASEDIYRTRFDGNTESNSPFFSDPLYSAQGWVFKMINLLPVWRQGLTGAGVRVRVNDDGVNFEHEDISSRFDMEGSCDGFFGVQEASDPEDPNDHGTSVASILGAEANNGHCSVGVAPGVTISACYTSGDAAPETNDFLTEKIDSMDISQNSWGPAPCKLPEENGAERRNMQEIADCPELFQSVSDELVFPCDVCDFDVPTVFDLSDECQTSIQDHCLEASIDQPGCRYFVDLHADIDWKCQYSQYDPETYSLLEKLVEEGRDGKGIIIVFAAGNDAYKGVDINFDFLAYSRFTISVAAVGQNGKVGLYSTPGAAVMVAAPGGDSTDSNENELVGAGITSSTSCKAVGVGTSFAAPVVSGVIALMLEANPNLSWEDVQDILVSTSRVPGFPSSFDKDQGASSPSESSVGLDGAVTNAAGFTHSYDLGFGIVDALAAVTLAREWVSYRKEITFSSVSEVINATIPDDRSDPLVLTVDISSSDTGVDEFSIKNVLVVLGLDHSSRGDLKVEITSPSGTVSLLSPGNRNEVTEDNLVLTTLRSWGESPVGTWTLTITDVSPGNVDRGDELPPSMKLLQWGMNIFGRDLSEASEMKPTSTPVSAPTVAPASAPVSENEPVMSPVTAPTSAAVGASQTTLILVWTVVTFAFTQVA